MRLFLIELQHRIDSIRKPLLRKYFKFNRYYCKPQGKSKKRSLRRVPTRFKNTSKKKKKYTLLVVVLIDTWIFDIKRFTELR